MGLDWTKPMQTKSGKRVLCHMVDPREHVEQPLIVCLEGHECTECYCLDGRYGLINTDEMDLVNVPDPAPELWVVIAKHGGSIVCPHSWHMDESDAQHSSHHLINSCGYYRVHLSKPGA